MERNGKTLTLVAPITTGEANMCHSLANISEHHHFKFDSIGARRSAYHFFGADEISVLRAGVPGGIAM